MIVHYSPEYAKYSSDEEDEDDAVLGEAFVKEREIDEQEIDKVPEFIIVFICDQNVKLCKFFELKKLI